MESELFYSFSAHAQEPHMPLFQTEEHVHATSVAHTNGSSVAYSQGLLPDLQGLLASFPDGVLKLDASGTILTCNAAARSLLLRILTVVPADLFTFAQLRTLQARDSFGYLLTLETSPVARLLQGERLTGLHAPVIRFATLEGRELYIQMSGSPLYASQSTVQGALLVLRDVTEITQRKRYLDDMMLQGVIEQRRSRERAERAKRISALSSDYAYAYQLLPDGTLKREWTTEAFTRITGYDPAELDTQGWEAAGLYHPDDEPLHRARLRAMQAGQPDVQEWRLLTRAGETRWFRDSCHPVKSETDGIIHVYGAAHDITEQKQIELQVYQLTQRLSTVFESIADGITICDRDGMILQMNEAAITLGSLHLRPEFRELPLRERLSLLHLRDEYDQELAFEHSPHYRILQGEVMKSESAMDILITALDGRRIYLNVSGAPVCSMDGVQIGAVMIFRDVTVLRQQEQRTQRALTALLQMAETLVHFPEQLLRADELADLAAHTMRQEVTNYLLALTCELLGCNLAGIVTINPLTERLVPVAILGLTCERKNFFWSDIPGMRLSDYFSVEQRALLAAGEAVLLDATPFSSQALEVYGFQKLLVAPLYIREQFLGLICVDYTHNEQVYPLQEATTLFKVIGKLAALVIERERLIHERIVAQAKALAESETNRQKDEFLRLASQELRTPLATIKANLQLTRRRLRQIDDQIPTASLLQQLEEMLDRGERQVAVESRLIGDLLDVSRIQEQALRLHTRLCNMYDVVRNVVADLHAGNTLRTILVLEPDIDMFPVVADVDRIGQVLTNYITNAMKYSPVDKPIEVVITDDGEFVQVAVRDQGPGIAQAYQQDIWERYFQIPDRVVYSGSSGLGLGLHISQMLIKQHNGSVGVESQPGQGSTFWFTLPLALE